MSMAFLPFPLITSGFNSIFFSMSARFNRSIIPSGFYIGSSFTTVFLLLIPWSWMGVIALVGGSIASIWWEIRGLGHTLTHYKAASLGFYSTFTGVVMAILIAQIAETFFAEQLWRLEHLYRLPPLIATKGLNFESPDAWYVWIIGLVIVSILAGAIGAPMGIVATKIFKPAKGVTKAPEDSSSENES